MATKKRGPGTGLWRSRAECAAAIDVEPQTIDRTYRPDLPEWAQRTVGREVEIDLAVVSWLYMFKKTGIHPRDRCPHCGEPVYGAQRYPINKRTLADWDGKKYCDD